LWVQVFWIRARTSDYQIPFASMPCLVCCCWCNQILS
jgi:hypothetical protein